MWFFVESVPGTLDCKTLTLLFLFFYPQTTCLLTPPENMLFCGKCTWYGTRKKYLPPQSMASCR